jgi:uncharacterized membrane protein YhhN
VPHAVEVSLHVSSFVPIFSGACAAFVIALLVADRARSRTGVWVAKPAASASFVACALAAGAAETAYGKCVLAALVLSFVGDVLLLPEGTGPTFMAGVGAFGLAHVAFAAAFVVRGVAAASIEGAAFVFVPAAVAFAIAFARRVEGPLRPAVVGYACVLSAMTLLAIGTYGAHGGWEIAAGALAFYFSDLSVALDRFVKPSFGYRVWGLPLYYGAQLLFAASVR